MRLRWGGCGCALALVLWACNQQQPGDLVGVYQINGELTENSCGNAALPAQNPLEFAVEIRRLSESEGLWIQGSPPGNTGSLDARGAFEFRSEGSFDVNPPDPGGSEHLLEMDPLTLANLDTFEAFEGGAMQPTTCVLGLSEVARGELRDPGDAGASSGPALDAGASSGPALEGENEIQVRAGQGDCELVLASQGGVFEQLPCRAHYTLSGQLRQ